MTLKRYHVTLPHGVTTVMKLNEEDAKRYGGTLVEDAGTAEGAPAVKARRAPNKSRTAANKDETP